jgi:hypothetical protein
MPLTPEGEAHMRRCMRDRCPHWIVSHGEAARRGTQWADFCAYHGTDPAAWIALNAERWQGPESNCPAGRWTGAPLPDLEAEAEQARLRKAGRQVRELGPVLEALLADQPVDVLCGHLERLEADGLLEPEARRAVEDELTGRTTTGA